jgi:hypothetical protein
MVKRLKREGDEFRSVVDQCISICAQHGVTIQFPWEVPKVLAELLDGKVPLAAQVPQGNSAEESRRRLADFSRSAHPSPSSRSVPSPASAQSAPVSPPPVANSSGGPVSMDQTQQIWDNLVDGLDVEHPAPQPQVAPPADQPSPAPKAPQSAPPMSMEEMQKIAESRQAAMLARVQQQGVRYKGSPGPLQGQNVEVDDSVDLTPAENVSDGEYQSPYATGGNPKHPSGLTREEMAQKILEATGKMPSAPTANPVPKPPGF